LIIDRDEGATCLAEEVSTHDVEVILSADPADALLQAGLVQPDAVLLGPDIAPLDPPTVVRALIRRSRIPVLVGVGEDDGRSVTEALAAGALACVARPYRSREILAILRSIVRDEADRQPHDPMAGHPLACLTVGPVRIDPAARNVQVRGRSIQLPPQEFRLLHLLMRNVGRVVTRDQIWAEVWGEPRPDSSNTVTVHIRRLRARLGEGPDEPVSIVTVRGMGYRLTPSPPRTDPG
jgi:DNA-binding response OmpR family regulator